VKNVTGYDLCKLIAGSWGTLAAMTDVTVKVLPRAETEASVLVMGLDDARACEAMAAAMGSSCDVSGAAHLPDHIASFFTGVPKPEATTALRLEGVAPSVAHRREMLAALMKPFGPVEMLEADQSRALWRDVRDVKPFTLGAARERPLWRISVPPAQGHAIAATVTPAAQMYYDWGGGLIWLAMPFAGEPGAAAIREAVAAVGGHATLVRADPAVRAAVDVFQPEQAAIAALNKRVKESFDPKGLLNPGRLWAGV
jgi:glycolate oxidase FAD binding subunit